MDYSRVLLVYQFLPHPGPHLFGGHRPHFGEVGEAPSLSVGHVFQILIILASYKNHLLCEKFNNNDAFYTWVKLVMSLPLLPRDRISDMWQELKNDPLPNIPTAPLRKFTFNAIDLNLLKY